MDKFDGFNQAQLEEFYANAERNIVGYKRPADWQTRLTRVKSRRPNPATEGEGRYNERRL